MRPAHSGARPSPTRPRGLCPASLLAVGAPSVCDHLRQHRRGCHTRGVALGRVASVFKGQQEHCGRSKARRVLGQAGGPRRDSEPETMSGRAGLTRKKMVFQGSQLPLHNRTNHLEPALPLGGSD